MPKQKGTKLGEYFADLISQQGLSAPAVVRKAEEKGHDVLSLSYVKKIMARKAGDFTLPRIHALADALDEDPFKLVAIRLGLERPEGFLESQFWKLYEDYIRLEKPAHRIVIDEVLKGAAKLMAEYPKKKKADSHQKTARQ